MGLLFHSKDDLVFELLDKTKHDRHNFECGVPELNEFISKYAGQQQSKHLNKVYVATTKSSETLEPIIGYYTLSAHSLTFETFPEKIVTNFPKDYPIPTLKIGRLARDLHQTTKGFGQLILADALYRALRISKEVGVFAVEVDAKNERLKQFYQAVGFVSLIDDPLGLILPIKTLEKVF